MKEFIIYGNTFWEEVYKQALLKITKSMKENKNELIITPPEGYEIDKIKSTLTKIIFKKIELTYSDIIDELRTNETISLTHFSDKNTHLHF